MAITEKCRECAEVNQNCDKCVRYRGAVLCTREENYHDDSDFYAVAWDGTKLVQVYYASTRYGGGGDATVDATEEVKVDANAWLTQWALLQLTAADTRQAGFVQNGRRVRVYKGRKVPIGTEGIIFYWAEQTFSPRYRNGYKSGPDAVKVGVATSDRKDARGRYVDVAWTYAANCEVIDHREYLTSSDELKKQAAGFQGHWNAPFAKLQVV